MFSVRSSKLQAVSFPTKDDTAFEIHLECRAILMFIVVFVRDLEEMRNMHRDIIFRISRSCRPSWPTGMVTVSESDFSKIDIRLHFKNLREYSCEASDNSLGKRFVAGAFNGTQ
ncbi:hypothetical protein AVEN_168505-1 [Araneus ventricosus]|uniref:Uncharacterized protein n=1 Tax=Araneus ventricosus TaxID=182803 RepID=A0A4Y2TNK9_ARAVE|nr:hypothetical protein AVEN_168505-1 [Araneus ventricosus]